MLMRAHEKEDSLAWKANKLLCGEYLASVSKYKCTSSMKECNNTGKRQEIEVEMNG